MNYKNLTANLLRLSLSFLLLTIPLAVWFCCRFALYIICLSGIPSTLETRQDRTLKLDYYRKRYTANSKTSVAVDFGGKRLRFWSRGFVCQRKKVNACGHIPVRDLTGVGVGVTGVGVNRRILYTLKGDL